MKDFKEWINEDKSPGWLPEDFNFRKYVSENLPLYAKKTLVPNDIDHVSDILKKLSECYSGIKSNDDFVKILLSENYDKALLKADEVNKVSMFVYLLFQMNKVPIALRDKFKIK